LPQHHFTNCCQCQHAGLAFDSCNNLVVCKRWENFEVYCYHDGSLQRHVRDLDIKYPRSGMALDDAGHVIMCEANRMRVLRYSDASCVMTIPPQSSFGPPQSSFGPINHSPLPEYLSDDDERVSDDDNLTARLLLLSGDVDPFCRKRFQPCSVAVDDLTGDVDPFCRKRFQPCSVAVDDLTGGVDPFCRKPFEPCSVAVDSDGNIAVYDFGNRVVKVFRVSDGSLIRSIGGRLPPSMTSNQCGIAFDMEGNLVVTNFSSEEHNNLLVLRYSDGSVIRTIELRNVQPVGIAFDGAGHVVVVDFLRFVHVLRYSDGLFVRTIPLVHTVPIQPFSHSYIEGSVVIDTCGRIALVLDRHLVVIE
jgi:hypothetical protein